MTKSFYYLDIIRVRLVNKNTQKKTLTCITTENGDKEIIVKYGIAPLNSEFALSIEHFNKGDRINLIECTIDQEGCVIPSFLVLEPDYLVDASAIAECFQDYLVSPLHYFRNKFEEKENRSYLLLGNLANYFLDELVFADDPEKVVFEDVFLQSFKNSPFEYASCQDIQVDNDFRQFMQNARSQFENIRRVVIQEFPKHNIDANRCTLEPSFFSERFGFQGRLDLWQSSPQREEATIVELKSGKLPFPIYNRHKITQTHEVQTAVYRMMIDSVFGKSDKVNAHILYSAAGERENNMRAAERDESLDKKIVNIRNLIVANEKLLMQGDNTLVANIFSQLFQTANNSGRIPAFYINGVSRMEKRITESSMLEQNYLFRFTSFISKELYHQKVGNVISETPTGTASLWNTTFDERAESLDVIFNLSIIHIEDENNNMTIRFARDETKNILVNFREGDICIVYPKNSDKDTVLNHQILKGTITNINPETVDVRFRYKQKNRHYFDDNKLWTIEHDALDSAHNYMYKSLFAFLNASQCKKDLLLGQIPPKVETGTQNNTITRHDGQHQNDCDMPYPDNIIQQASKAKDYFLIVGPPGTGKTSIFARKIIETYYSRPETNIMVIAYTNRAVDELCDAIHAGLGNQDGLCDAYIRIGSKFSCAPPYRHRLLQTISERSANRAELLDEISRTRVFVSTLASINGRMELFSIKHFHTAIIDEASQILEPQIIGLLTRFDNFIMIGDHNQLSTIVLQDNLSSPINDPILQEAGITDCRLSLFERLISRCVNKGWRHAYAQLAQQGRMHEEIAAFPAKYFYPQELSVVADWQTGEWNMSTQSEQLFHKLIANRRTAFISTENINRPESSNKINETEAEVIDALAHALYDVYKENGKQIDAASIGIIAPYRNQVALIRQKLIKSGLPEAERIMIETVERFQGSQRNVILMSFCVNHTKQMEFLCNTNKENTVDRKLNVAITRARQQLFLVGNATILRDNPIYARLLNHYRDNTLIL